MVKKNQLLTGGEIKNRSAICVREIKRLDLKSSSIKNGLRRNKIQRDFAILLVEFMEKNKIVSIQELADCLFIGNDHIEVLEWLRNPTLYNFGTKKQDRDYLIALCGYPQ